MTLLRSETSVVQKFSLENWDRMDIKSSGVELLLGCLASRKIFSRIKLSKNKHKHQYILDIQGRKEYIKAYVDTEYSSFINIKYIAMIVKKKIH